MHLINQRQCTRDLQITFKELCCHRINMNTKGKKDIIKSILKSPSFWMELKGANLHSQGGSPQYNSVQCTHVEGTPLIQFHVKGSCRSIRMHSLFYMEYYASISLHYRCRYKQCVQLLEKCTPPVHLTNLYYICIYFWVMIQHIYAHKCDDI